MILRSHWDLFDFPGTKQQVSFEDLQTHDDEWLEERQFIVLTSDIVFKTAVVNHLHQRRAHFFSILANDSSQAIDIKIGRGTFINRWNDMAHSDISIGNHCILTCFVQLSDQVTLADFCHISAHSFLNHCSLGPGCVLGVNTVVVPAQETKLTVASYTNILMSSTVTKSLIESGTYKDNRKLSTETSLTKRIL